MIKTGKKDIPIEQKIMIPTDELQALCGCGRQTAVKIGTSAGAKIVIGKRVLWNVRKIQAYLDYVSGSGGVVA